MEFEERLKKFVIFIILTLITFGLYPFWWVIVMAEERNKILREIRDDLQKRCEGDVYAKRNSVDDASVDDISIDGKILVDKLLDVIIKHPGLTARELSEKIHGADGYQQRVNEDCRLLLNRRLVQRRGAGGTSDPYRYYPA